MKKIIGVFFLIVVISLASAAAYIYFSTKNAVDSMIESVRPFVSIKYQRFSNPMDGSISIHGVSIDDGYGTNVDVGSIELKLDSALDYVNFDKKISSGEILPKLQLQINHVFLDLDFIKNEDPNTYELISSYIPALGCGDIKSINVDQLPELGYSGMDGSLNLNFEYDKLNSEAKMELGLMMHGMGSYSIQTSIPNIYSAEDFANPNNKISNLELKIQDLGYSESLIEYCTKQSGLETAAYIEQHMQELKKYLSDANISLSDDLYAAYQAYFVGAATLTFASQPTSAVNLQYIDLYETKDWPKILGLTVHVNDKQLTDLDFSWDKDTVMQDLMTAQAGSQDEALSRDPQTRAKQILKGPQTYFEIPVSNLDNYINSQVKLETKLGRIYKGYVKGVTRSQVIVVIRLKGGKAEIPVGTNKIAKAFVANN